MAGGVVAWVASAALLLLSAASAEPPSAAERCEATPNDVPVEWRTPVVAAVYPNVAPVGTGGEQITLQVHLPACFNHSNATDGRSGASFDNAACVWYALGDDDAIVDTSNVLATLAADKVTAFVSCATPPRNSSGLTYVSFSIDGGANIATAQKFRFADKPEIFGLSPARGVVAGGTMVTIAGKNLAMSKHTWCNFGGIVSPGRTVKLSANDLRDHCRHCATEQVEQGDGLVANKTVCRAMKCDQKDIEAQKYRVVCLSPARTVPGTVSVSVSFGTAVDNFYTVPNGDFTYSASAKIVSVDSSVVSFKGGDLTKVTIATQVPSRHVMCKYGNTAVCALGHPLSLQDNVTISPASNPSDPSSLVHQTVQCRSPVFAHKPHSKPGEVMRTTLSVSLDGGNTWSEQDDAIKMTVQDTPDVKSVSPCKGLRIAGFQLIEVHASNLDAGLADYRCRFNGQEVVPAIRTNTSVVSCYTIPRLQPNIAGMAAETSDPFVGQSVTVELSSDGGESFGNSAATYSFKSMMNVTSVSATSGKPGDPYWARVNNGMDGIEYMCKFGSAVIPAKYDSEWQRITCTVPPAPRGKKVVDVSVSLNGIVFVTTGSQFRY